MCRPTKLNSLLCVLLIGGLPSCLAETFTQCTNEDTDTFIVVDDDCTSYIYCNGEDSFRDSCPDQTYFDAKAQECTFDDEGVCLAVPAATTDVADEEPNEPSGDDQLTATTAQVTEDIPAGGPSQTPPVLGTRPRCELSGDGYHPHPQRCEYYYSCIGGYLTIVRCPHKYGWDYTLQQCRPLAEAQCLRL